MTTLKIGDGYSKTGEYILFNRPTGGIVIGCFDDIIEYLESLPEDANLEDIEISEYKSIGGVEISRIKSDVDVAMMDNTYDEESESFTIFDAKTNKNLGMYDYESDALEEIATLIADGTYPDAEALRLVRDVRYTCCYEAEKTTQFSISIPSKKEKEMTYHEINDEIARLVALRAKFSPPVPPMLP